MNHEKREIVDTFMEVVGETVYGEKDYHYSTLQQRSLEVHRKLMDDKPSYVAAFNRLSEAKTDSDKSALIKRLKAMSGAKDSFKKDLKAISMIVSESPLFVREALANYRLRREAMPYIEREFGLTS